MAKKRRRSNGEGTIYQVDGKWIAQISYYKDGKLKRPKRTCTKHADAVAKLEELRREAQQLDMDEQHHMPMPCRQNDLRLPIRFRTCLVETVPAATQSLLFGVYCYLRGRVTCF